VDVVQIDRIRRSLTRFGERFAKKILAPAEIELFSRAQDPAAWLAKRFAAKEAAAKALGTGMRAGVYFSQIAVTRKPSGAPVLTLGGAAAARAESMGITGLHASISDEAGVAVAFVVMDAP